MMTLQAEGRGEGMTWGAWVLNREGDRLVNRGGAWQGKEMHFDPCFHANVRR